MRDGEGYGGAVEEVGLLPKDEGRCHQERGYYESFKTSKFPLHAERTLPYDQCF
jgi:hypothetical protein